jgi:S-(hydroxymethyl)glutathione dehydrogenase/alcohol dehydrogenase
VGDHVIAVLTPSCGRCTFCGEGKPFLCKEMVKTMNEFTQLDGTLRTRCAGEDIYRMCAVGSFAEQAIIPEGAAIAIPKKYPLEKVCLIGCGVTTGVGAALNTAQVRPGTSVAIVGCGGVGLSILQGARIAGASTIVAVDPKEEKRELAIALGATHTVDPTTESPVKTVRKITAGGVHYAFEALGLQETMEQAYGMVRPTGTAVIVGVAQFGAEVSLKAGTFLQEKCITGSAYGSAVPRRDVPRYLEYYDRGELKLDDMITREIELEQINEAFDQMGRGEGARSVIVYR